MKWFLVFILFGIVACEEKIYVSPTSLNVNITQCTSTCGTPLCPCVGFEEAIRTANTSYYQQYSPISIIAYPGTYTDFYPFAITFTLNISSLAGSSRTFLENQQVNAPTLFNFTLSTINTTSAVVFQGFTFIGGQSLISITGGFELLSREQTLIFNDLQFNDNSNLLSINYISSHVQLNNIVINNCTGADCLNIRSTTIELTNNTINQRGIKVSNSNPTAAKLVLVAEDQLVITNMQSSGDENPSFLFAVAQNVTISGLQVDDARNETGTVSLTAYHYIRLDAPIVSISNVQIENSSFAIFFNFYYAFDVELREITVSNVEVFSAFLQAFTSLSNDSPVLTIRDSYFQFNSFAYGISADNLGLTLINVTLENSVASECLICSYIYSPLELVMRSMRIIGCNTERNAVISSQGSAAIISITDSQFFNNSQPLGALQGTNAHLIHAAVPSGSFSMNYCNFTDNFLGIELLYLISTNISNTNFTLSASVSIISDKLWIDNTRWSNMPSGNLDLFTNDGLIQRSVFQNSPGDLTRVAISFGNVVMDQCIFSNVVQAIEQAQGTTLIISNSSFSDLYEKKSAILSTANITISGSTFTNVQGSTGAALFLVSGYLNIDQSTFINCTAEGGGAISITGSSSGVISNSHFENNTALSTGGCVLVTGSSQLSIFDCVFNRNFALTGGALAFGGQSEVNVTRTTIINNNSSSSAGGCIFSESSKANFTHCLIHNNRAASLGGGLYVTNFADLGIYYSNLTQNSSPNEGGGMYFKDNSTTNMYGVKVKENICGSSGAGIAFAINSGGLIQYTEIHNNSAGSGGGGVSIHNFANPRFDRCNITQNQATSASGVLLSDSAAPVISNTIISNNTSVASAGGVLAADLSTGQFSGCIIAFNLAKSGSGGGIYLQDFAAPEFVECLIIGNTATNGGGMAITSGEPALLNQCIFTGNMAEYNGGAMVFLEDSNATIINSLCTLNLANGNGGCAHLEDASSPHLSMSITNNSATTGGGISTTDVVNITVFDSYIAFNKANQTGGGIYLEASVKGRIYNSSIVNNEASSMGGGIFSEGGPVECDQVHFSGNRATNGGGLGVDALNSFSMSFINCSFTSNLATVVGSSDCSGGSGGGIYVLVSEGSASNLPESYNFDSCILQGNRADYGGAAYVSALDPPTFHHSVFMENYACKMGGAIFIATKQQPAPTWIFNSAFDNNNSTWGGCNVAWNYLTNVTQSNLLCTSCEYSSVENATGYQTVNGSATLPAVMTTNNCPPTVTLNTSPFVIGVTIKDQFGTIVKGAILEDNQFDVILTDSGCAITDDSNSTIVDYLTGEANFEIYTMSGHQNDSCDLTFSLDSNSTLQVSQIQATTCSILLYGCSAEYELQEGEQYDSCVPSGYNPTSVLALVALCLICLMICILLIFGGAKLRRVRTKRKLAKMDIPDFESNPNISIDDILRDPMIPHIPQPNLELVERIGRGASGLVWRANWQCGSTVKEVAVKELMFGVEGFDQDTLREFLKEIKLMSALHHDKIVRFIAISCPNPDKLLLITELMHRGSLRELLDRAPDLSWNIRVKFAIDAARGVEYLHSKNLIHRDLKAANLLVNSQGVCKVADFGISTVKPNVTRTMTCVGTPIYMAPEVLTKNKYSEKADVYSFGIVLLELFTGRLAYSEPEFSSMHIAQLTYQIAHVGARPSVDGLHPTVRQLIVDCWHEEPGFRPSFSEIVTRLNRILKMKIDVVFHSDDIIRGKVSSLKDLSQAYVPLVESDDEFMYEKRTSSVRHKKESDYGKAADPSRFSTA